MSLVVDIKKKLGSFNLSVNFQVQGSALGILGASGCGKSMTLRCIAGVLTPDEGEIILNDRVLYSSASGVNLPPQQRHTGLLFQNYALFPNMTVQQNVACAMRGRSAGQPDLQRIGQYLELFRLQGLENRYPRQLSGGQQQRVALARTLATEPEILMFDEPFSALDYHLRQDLQQEFLQVLQDFTGDVLYVTHNVEEILLFCQGALILKNGSVEQRLTTLEQTTEVDLLQLLR